MSHPDETETPDPNAPADPPGDGSDVARQPRVSRAEEPPEDRAQAEDEPQDEEADAVDEAGGADEAPMTETPPPAPKTEVELLREQLADAERRASEAAARLRVVSKAYTDLQSEMHDFRQRMEHQAKMTAARKGAAAVQAFFDPVQNLKRSLDTHTGDLEILHSGLKMVLQQFQQALERLGLREVPGVGATFDPNLHEALAVMPVPDKAQDGKVLMVHTTGYALDGHTIQPSQVVIGKYEEPAEA